MSRFFNCSQVWTCNPNLSCTCGAALLGWMLFGNGCIYTGDRGYLGTNLLIFSYVSAPEVSSGADRVMPRKNINAT